MALACSPPSLTVMPSRAHRRRRSRRRRLHRRFLAPRREFDTQSVTLLVAQFARSWYLCHETSFVIDAEAEAGKPKQGHQKGERKKEGRSFWRRRSGEDRERKDTVRESRAGPTSGPRLPASWQLKKCVGGVAWRRLLIFDGAAGRTRSWPRPAAAAATLPPPLPNLPCLAAALPPHCT